MEIQDIHIPAIQLQWSTWYPWKLFLLDARKDPNGITPPNASGVYEAKYEDEQARLTIGKASNLRKRVKQGLVKGKVSHSSGKRIRKFDDTTNIVIRWAETDRPSAIEEELHRLYKEEHNGNLPKRTLRT